MTSTLRSALMLALTVAVLSACAESAREEATGKSGIRAVNAIADAADVLFKIEERSLGGVGFADASQLQRYDDLSYNFNFDLTVPGESSTRRLATEFVDVAPDRGYLFILRGSIANPDIWLIDEEERAWSEGETVFEMGFINLNTETGPVDIYFDAPGTAPVLGAARASIANGERVAPVELPEGNYVVTVTTAGDPLDVLFTSLSRNYLGASTDNIVLFDSDPSRTATISVRLLSGTGTSLPLADSRFPPVGRIRHAAFGIGNVDVAEDDDFTNLLISNQAFGEVTGDIPLTAGTTDYTWTDAGNPGAIVHESSQAVASGLKLSMGLVGPVGTLDVLNTASNRRPFSTSGRITFIQAASSQDAVDIYLLPAGESVDDNDPSSAGILFKQSTGTVSIPPDDYEISITPSGEKTLLAGPVAVDIALRDVLEVWLVETADPNVLTVDVTRY